MTKSSLSESALLVSLNVSMWSGVKLDKSLATEVELQHGMGANSGKYSKNLLTKDALKNAIAASGALRTYVREQTSPWLDGGVRILAAVNYAKANERITNLIDDFESAAQNLCARLPEEKAAARVRLNGSYRDSDYPDDLRAKFSAAVRYFPLPDERDFRVQAGEKITAAERATLQAGFAKGLQEAESAAIADIWGKLAGPVAAMAGSLVDYTPATATTKAVAPFRDSLVSNIQNIVDLIPNLDFSANPDLERVRKQVRDTLLVCTPAALRDDSALRADVAARAAKIAADIAELTA